VAALIIYHDLLAFSRSDDSHFTTLLTRANLYVDWASTEWQPRLVSFEWPEPPVATFFQYDRFKSAWGKAIVHENVRDATLPEMRVERLAFAWLSAGTSVVANEPAICLPGIGEPVPWPDLHKQLKLVIQNDGDTTPAMIDNCSEWLVRIAELLMPEFGLPENVIVPFTKLGVFGDFWQKNRLDILQRRAERLAELARVEPQLAEKLRTSELLPATGLAPEAETIDRLLEGTSWSSEPSSDMLDEV
jgi:hypothetical protein